MDFETYRRLVDGWVNKLAGVRLDDLPDVDLVSWHEDDVPPKNAAKRALREAGGEAE